MPCDGHGAMPVETRLQPHCYEVRSLLLIGVVPRGYLGFPRLLYSSAHNLIVHCMESMSLPLVVGLKYKPRGTWAGGEHADDSNLNVARPGNMVVMVVC